MAIHQCTAQAGWQRLGAQVEALLFMPAREVLIAGMAMLLLSLLSLSVLAWTFDIPRWPLPESGSALVEALIKLSTNILDQWQNHLAIMGTIAGAWILVPLFLWNRNLPRSLHFPLTFLMAAFKAVAEIGPIKEVLQTTPLKRLGEFVQSHTCSQTSRRLWLRRQLYGYRLFDRIRPGALPPRLIAFLNVDVPTQADLEDMRLLLEICPNNQPVVMLTQMSGLSMLTSAYLDVWFPQIATSSTRPPTAYILHDLNAGRIQPLPDPRSIQRRTMRPAFWKTSITCLVGPTLSTAHTSGVRPSSKMAICSPSRNVRLKNSSWRSSSGRHPIPT